MIELEAAAMAGRYRLQDAQSFGDHFLADAVAGNDGDSVGAGLAHSEYPGSWLTLHPVVHRQRSVDYRQGLHTDDSTAIT
jgi:hypothetical protein